eukprot:TRINITY_DN77799_c0_g1_i1.p2 TRINITY_DN77799_c0_g1~~TRINITY_DN77799_c0_g1_i1.p2  ORF type:complete len:108 (-),score=18.53 TRINITY_DN77799_c0_g1_i1:102-425(-)
MSSMPERLKEYHRSLRPKKHEELSMKQVACFFGGLYAVIHLLQYFDIWTLMLMAVVVFFLFRQVQQNWHHIWAATSKESTDQSSYHSSSSSGKGTKAAKGKKGRAQD